jgi:hypothetical protein
MNSYNSPTTKYIYRGNQVIWYIVGILNIFLFFRFVLKLLIANPEAGFTSFIYTVTKPFITPFISVFGISKLEENVFEWTTLLAMVVYSLLGWGLSKLFLMSTTVSTPEAATKLRKQENS